MFSDEALYALHSRFLNNPRFTVTMPNVLYFYVYHPTSWFGVNHIVVAKALNAVFFGLSLFPLYATARRFLSKPAAYVFSVGIVLSPVSSYSVYVMPESMYFFVFWVLAYIVVVQLPHDVTYGGLYSGITLAALSAVKPHGLILTATVPVVLVCLYFQRPDEISVSQLIRATLAYCAAFIVGRLIINYLARGDFVISPFGNYYAELLKPSMKPKHPLLSSGLWYLIRGHLTYLAVLFWPALVLVVWPSDVSDRKTRDGVHYVALLSFSFAVLLLLIFMAAKYTVDVHGAVVPKDVCRLHGRYYNFALGTLVLLFLARTSAASFPLRRSRVFVFVLVGGAIAAGGSACFAFLDYCPNSLDFPEVVCFSMFRIGLALVILGSIGSAVSLAFFTRTTARLVYLAFIGTLALTTSAAVFVGQVLFIPSPPEPDLAAIAVRNLVPNQIDDGIVLARTEDVRSYRAMLQLYSLSERRILDKAVLTADDIPAGKKWALLLDPYALNLPFYSRVHGKGFEFIQLAPGGIVAADGANAESLWQH